MNFAMHKIIRHYSRRCTPKYFSQILRSKESVPKDIIGSSTLCQSFKLMLQHGMISSSSSGIYNLLPLAIISLDKLCTIVELLMNSVGGQKVLLPTLAKSSLWKTSGRWDNANAQLFKLQDRHGIEYCLGPTHEEVVTKMVADAPSSLKSFPLKVYQISTKFRDELKPRLGLLRGREFLMKDMYTFDTTEEGAKTTYSSVCEAYDKLFQMLGVDWVKVQGSSAGMGGSISHEYHFFSDIGEDKILHCSKCNTGVNAELSSEDDLKCSSCNSLLQRFSAIEVGHAFILGTAYSEPFDAKFLEEGISKHLHMGCYGLGLTRILAASVECLSKSSNIRWPEMISPFLLSIIPPKKGSKEEKASSFVSYLIQTLGDIDMLSDAIVVDDRTQMSIGRRIQEANNLGIPFVLVSGGTAMQDLPKFEVIDTCSGKEMFFTHAELMSFFRNYSLMLSNKFNVLCDL